ncbi:MAG: DUF4139 domain-containing protein [candidate division Zixibacteria bacterium]|nr:DUF4139 domain-containing protein [candidate division Zixibacteria bacterium]
MKTILIALGALICISSVVMADNADIAITVYNDNLALVREVRPLKFQKGIFDYRFTDVPSQIDPTSVHFKALRNERSIQILEQNYQYDLVNSDKIFEKYIDYNISAMGKNGQLYEGTLMSFSGNSIVIMGKKGDLSVVRTDELTDFRFEKLPEGLLTRPTLVWKFDSGTSGNIDCEVSYLTNGINWHCEYVAVVAEDDKSLELSGWVSIENKSGGAFNNAKVKLIAGEVNIVKPQRDVMFMEEKVRGGRAGATPQFEEKSFFEYHLYTLQRRADIKNNEIKQITLIPASEVKAKKVYTFGGGRTVYRGRGNQDADVKVTLEFKNSKAEGLGMPLPKGKIRVYKMDTDNSMEFIGEDLIDHTPKDEMVRVYVGDAFDVVGEKKRSNYKEISRYVREESYEIKLRNHKDENIEVVVVENLYGWANWEITGKNFDYHKKDANTIEFKVPVKSDKESVLTYTVKYTNY